METVSLSLSLLTEFSLFVKYYCKFVSGLKFKAISKWRNIKWVILTLPISGMLNSFFRNYWIMSSGKCSPVVYFDQRWNASHAVCSWNHLFRWMLKEPGPKSSGLNISVILSIFPNFLHIFLIFFCMWRKKKEKPENDYFCQRTPYESLGRWSKYTTFTPSSSCMKSFKNIPQYNLPWIKFWETVCI